MNHTISTYKPHHCLIYSYMLFSTSKKIMSFRFHFIATICSHKCFKTNFIARRCFHPNIIFSKDLAAIYQLKGIAYFKSLRGHLLRLYWDLGRLLATLEALSIMFLPTIAPVSIETTTFSLKPLPSLPNYGYSF